MYYIARYNNYYGLSIGKVDNKNNTCKDHYPAGDVGHPFINSLSKYQRTRLFSGKTIIINKNNPICRAI